MKLENIIYCGDNLTWLKKFPDRCINLIYIDPPFFSNKNYEVIFNDGEEIRSFEDRWKGGINHYIEWMKDRVFELHRILKDTGSFYLHCDSHASHYLKVMCDDIFGYNNFQNEIIWQKIRTSKGQSNHFSNLHDNIFFYSKTNKITFNQQYLEQSNSYIDKYYNNIEAKTGRKYRLVNFFQGSQGSAKKFGDKTIEPPNGKHWIWSQDRIDEAIASNLIVFTKPDRPQLKRYVDEYKGRCVGSIWDDIYPINAVAKERLGYPTQKPEALLERIINSSSNKNDLILDPFCGCGTTIAVAQKLQRKWIGIDVSPSACKLMKNRVEKVGARGIEIIGLPVSIDQLKKLPHFEFQNWCVGALGGTVNPKKVGDMGIDGFTFMNRYPIQVKQSEHVGRNVIDNFETAIKRVKKDKGYIIAFSFTKGAYDEVARIRKDGLYIELLTVNDLLGFSEEKVSDKMFEFY